MEDQGKYIPQNRFTSQPKTLTADADGFTAVITIRGERNWHAAITYKPGKPHSGPVGLTADGEAPLKTALGKIDSSVRFYKKTVGTDATTERQSKDAQLVENMRTDPSVKDVAYFNAAKMFKIPIQARPDFTNTSGRATIVPVTQQVDELVEFENAHPELSYGGCNAPH